MFSIEIVASLAPAGVELGLCLRLTKIIKKAGKTTHVQILDIKISYMSHFQYQYTKRDGIVNLLKIYYIR